jgi:hypothetical protein
MDHRGEVVSERGQRGSYVLEVSAYRMARAVVASVKGTLVMGELASASVTFPRHNYGQYLMQCINSALGQLRPKLFQVTIWTRK